MSKMSQAQDLLVQAIALLDPPSRSHGDRADRSALAALCPLVPQGTQLYASQARPVGEQTEGGWYWYLVMPSGWRPPADGPRWIQNPSNYKWWDTGSAQLWSTEHKGPDPTFPNTKEAALCRGALRLFEVLAAS